jgi:hypothetical protein
MLIAAGKLLPLEQIAIVGAAFQPRLLFATKQLIPAKNPAARQPGF